MKKLVGGDYLLDLTPIELEQSEDVETYTSITNKEIIEQLTNLKKFVPNPSMVKPVWVKLKNGETDEIVVVRGEFKVVDTGEFEIVVAIDGYKLKIHIEFTQVLNSDDEPLDDWYIDTNDAKYLFTSDAQNIGAIIRTGEIENAKPIYWHGLDIYKSGQSSVQAHVLKNDNTPIDSIDKLIAWVKGTGASVVNVSVNGAFAYNSSAYTCYLLRFRISDGEITTIGIYFVGASGYDSIDVDEETFRTYFTNVEDVINKIN